MDREGRDGLTETHCDDVNEEEAGEGGRERREVERGERRELKKTSSREQSSRWVF